MYFSEYITDLNNKNVSFLSLSRYHFHSVYHGIGFLPYLSYFPVKCRNVYECIFTSLSKP